jgi:hypothetical protein
MEAFSLTLSSYFPHSTLVIVDAEFRVQRNPSEDGGPAGSSYLVQHKSCHVVSRPKTE